MKQYVTVGLAVLAGAALVEAALIPGLLIGGAAILAPKVLPQLRQRVGPRSSLLPLRTDAEARKATPLGFTISRALAKTITFRTLATAMDFTTLYVVVGDAVTAAGLAAFGFVVGPFVYWGHEKAWDHFRSPEASSVAQPVPMKLLPAPASA